MRLCVFALNSPRRRRLPREGRLFFLEGEFAVAGEDFDAVAGFEFAEEEFGGERVEDEVLDGALERAGTELGIEAFFRDQEFGGAVHVQG